MGYYLNGNRKQGTVQRGEALFDFPYLDESQQDEKTDSELPRQSVSVLEIKLSKRNGTDEVSLPLLLCSVTGKEADVMFTDSGGVARRCRVPSSSVQYVNE